ncbi:MAG TPA: phosphoribosyltransferase family protein [Pedobacter sp.]
MFWGRLPLTHATAQYYFTRRSAIQKLMHELKYRGNKELGLYLGRLMGQQLQASNRFRYLDALVPLPLFPAKERKRGFNQAELLCRGISEVTGTPVLTSVVIRTTNTESQTKKNRLERWENMKGRFVLTNKDIIQGKHVLLVDDVVTTGATLEACGKVILDARDTRLSIATLCISSSS